jgi:hypothetical protein
LETLVRSPIERVVCTANNLVEWRSVRVCGRVYLSESTFLDVLPLRGETRRVCKGDCTEAADAPEGWAETLRGEGEGDGVLVLGPGKCRRDEASG